MMVICWFTSSGTTEIYTNGHSLARHDALPSWSQVGEPGVEPVHTRQLHELHLQQPEAEREHDPDEQPLARAADAQGAEGERDLRQAQGQHVERVEPTAAVMLLELAGIQAAALPVVDATVQVSRGHVARAPEVAGVGGPRGGVQ